MEQELTTGLGERQVAQFVEDDEVHTREIIGHAALASGAGLGLEIVDQIHSVEEPAAGASADVGPCDGDGQMGLAGPCAGAQNDIALMGEEVAGREVAHQDLVDWRAVEREVIDVLRQRQLGDGDLVLDQARLLLGDRMPPAKTPGFRL